MNIITVTLNPAFDMHCYTEDFQPFHENLAKITACEAGGKGINISRALTVNGVDNVALAVVGEENEEAFIKSLRADKMDVRSIRWSGRIRENITLHTNNAPETRISFSGSAIAGERPAELITFFISPREAAYSARARTCSRSEVSQVLAYAS